MKVLKPETLTFNAAPGGFLALKTADGAEYRKVECVALFPLSLPGTYISVSGVTGTKKPEEIGILLNLSDLPADQQDLVKKEMDLRYLAPKVTDIKKISRRFGMEEWEIVTNRGEKTIFMQNLKENLSIRDDRLIMITDIEKCRYLVSDIRQLPPRARTSLESKLS